MPNEQKLKTRFCQWHKANFLDIKINLKCFKTTCYNKIIIKN